MKGEKDFFFPLPRNVISVYWKIQPFHIRITECSSANLFLSWYFQDHARHTLVDSMCGCESASFHQNVFTVVSANQR